MRVLKAFGWALLAVVSIPTIVGPMYCIAKIFGLWFPEEYKRWRTESPVFTGAFSVRVVNNDKT